MRMDQFMDSICRLSPRDRVYILYKLAIRQYREVGDNVENFKFHLAKIEKYNNCYFAKFSADPMFGAIFIELNGKLAFSMDMNVFYDELFYSELNTESVERRFIELQRGFNMSVKDLQSLVQLLELAEL